MPFDTLIDPRMQGLLQAIMGNEELMRFLGVRSAPSYGGWRSNAMRRPLAGPAGRPTRTVAGSRAPAYGDDAFGGLYGDEGSGFHFKWQTAPGAYGLQQRMSLPERDAELFGITTDMTPEQMQDAFHAGGGHEALQRERYRRQLNANSTASQLALNESGAEAGQHYNFGGLGLGRPSMTPDWQFNEDSREWFDANDPRQAGMRGPGMPTVDEAGLPVGGSAMSPGMASLAPMVTQPRGMGRDPFMFGRDPVGMMSDMRNRGAARRFTPMPVQPAGLGRHFRR